MKEPPRNGSTEDKSQLTSGTVLSLVRNPALSLLRRRIRRRHLFSRRHLLVDALLSAAHRQPQRKLRRLSHGSDHRRHGSRRNHPRRLRRPALVPQKLQGPLPRPRARSPPRHTASPRLLLRPGSPGHQSLHPALARPCDLLHLSRNRSSQRSHRQRRPSRDPRHRPRRPSSSSSTPSETPSAPASSAPSRTTQTSPSALAPPSSPSSSAPGSSSWEPVLPLLSNPRPPERAVWHQGHGGAANIAYSFCCHPIGICFPVCICLYFWSAEFSA